MPDKTNKIIVPFSMCMPQKLRLEEVLKKNIRRLNYQESKAKSELHELIRETFPQGALDELANILNGDSEYGFLIENLPENQDIDFANLDEFKDGVRQNSFTYHIGKALYEMFGVTYKSSSFAVRSSASKSQNKGRLGSMIHRDFLGGNIIDVEQPKCFVAFSSPLNNEDAPTNIFKMRDVLLNLPENFRRRVKASVVFQQSVGDVSAKGVAMNLQEVLENLQDDLQNSQRTISEIDPGDNRDFGIANSPEDIEMFNQSVKAVAEPVVVGVGRLLIFSEDHIFHQSCPGNPESMKLIPVDDRYSRILVHSGGALER